MARLPIPGGDSGDWGAILNDYLVQTHKSDGTLKDNIITSATLAPNAVDTTAIADGSIEEAKLASSVQIKLNAVAGTPDWSTLTNKPLVIAAGADQAAARLVIGAGTSDLTLAGTGSATTAAKSDHTHAASTISDSTVIGRTILTAVDAAAVKTSLSLTKSDVGLGNVDNTSDANKNAAIATLTNKTISGSSNTLSNIPESAVTNLTTDLASKEPAITAGTTGQYWRGDKTWQALDKNTVGLNNVDNTSDATKNSAVATLTNKTISGANNTVLGTSGMLMPCQVSTQGSESYTIASGTVTQIAGTTINGYTPLVGDRVLIVTAPAASGVGVGFNTTLQPGNGIYRVTGNTTNISLTRAADMSGSENPSGKLVWVQDGTWSPRTLWWVQTPTNSNTAFTWGTTAVDFVPAFGGNGSTAIFALDTTFFTIHGNSNAVRLAQNSAAVADQTLTFPAVTTDTLISRTSTDTLTNKTLDNTNSITVKDTNLTLQDDGDASKQAKLQLSGITTGTTRTYTLPDASGTLALTSVLPPIRFSAPTAVLGVTPTDYAYSPRTLVGAHMRVASAPVGSALTAEVQHWDGFTWTTIGTLTIANGSATEAVISFSQAQVASNMVRLNVTSVGSSTAATGVAVDILVG